MRPWERERGKKQVPRFARNDRTAKSAALALRLWRDWLARGHVRGKHDVHLPVGLILHDDEGIGGLAVRAELERPAGKQRVLQFSGTELIANRGLVEAARLFNGLSQDAHSLVGGGRVPGIGRVAGGRGVVGIKFLHL